MDAVTAALPPEYIEEFDPVVVVLIQPKQQGGVEPSEETHGIAARGVKDVREVMIELLAAAGVIGNTLGTPIAWRKLLPQPRMLRYPQPPDNGEGDAP
jgi:hypothetical protein